MKYGQQLVMVAGIRPGDRVLLSGWNKSLEVVSNDDSALLTILSPEGKEFKAGRMTVIKVFPANGPDAEPDAA